METVIELDEATALVATVTLEPDQEEEECYDDGDVVDRESDSSEDDEKTEPLTGNKYERSIVYKIRYKNDDINDIYVGSTALTLEQRKCLHEGNVTNSGRRSYNYRVYAFIRAHGGWSDWIMETIEVYPCQSKKELLKREGHWVKTLGATLNMQIPGRTKKEWEADNKEYIAAKNKIRNADPVNKERNAINHRAYVDANKEHVAAREKAYVAAHREQKTASKKAWNDANKAHVAAYAKEQLKILVVCECGTTVKKVSISTHRRSEKHKKLLANLPPAEPAVEAPVTITV